ncbi:hypothetical protein GQX73_g9643 [Xylaria multiplex]|uniref:C2H2-type domain-containing protein n=1 Tax=Xylaria multiplex TaxID=323545 RepID=A0A7C8MMP5_9PEZI|nr:hypothetical protein GQX73_g9643 [Xylaria multiplex]
MARFSDLIDHEAVALDIFQATEWRKTEGENARRRESQRHTEQLQAVLDWLTANENQDQEMKLEWLSNRCHEGTSSWITNNPKFRAWLQRGRGNPVLWLHGKPGSGIYSLARNPPASAKHPTFAHRKIGSQAKTSSANVLRRLLLQLIQIFDDLRIVVDGVDEVSHSAHQLLIKELLSLVRHREAKCRLLIVSQDLPSISSQLSRIPQLSLNEERKSIEKDLSLIIRSRLQDIDNLHQGALGTTTILSLTNDILAKAEGMFLWVHLILELLSNASNLSELEMQIKNLPADLVEAYKKILNNIISRCSSNDLAKMKRIFSWIIYHKGRHPLHKYQVRVAMILNPDCQRITRETRPFANATDICKPFVEDGPGGSLVFVHSSVPQFLLDPGSGPFLHASESKLSLASACLNRYVGAVAGFYALLPYASEYWMDHLLECLDDIQFDQRTQESQHLHQALKTYNETVQFVMGQPNVDGISQGDLLAFKEEFGLTAFVCDVRGCERATLGFSSKADLTNHKALHDGTLKCIVHGCAYSEHVGFKSTKDLQGHLRKRHRTEEIRRVPKRFRQTLHDVNEAQLESIRKYPSSLLAPGSAVGHLPRLNRPSAPPMSMMLFGELERVEQKDERRLMMEIYDEDGQKSVEKNA